jgi:hypothetical protein
MMVVTFSVCNSEVVKCDINQCVSIYKTSYVCKFGVCECMYIYIYIYIYIYSLLFV